MMRRNSVIFTFILLGLMPRVLGGEGSGGVKKDMFYVPSGIVSTIMPNFVAPSTLSERDAEQYRIALRGDEPYRPGPDSQRQDGVPEGDLIKRHHQSRIVYPGVSRDYWLYVPKQYSPETTANLLIFQDGGFYLGPEVQANIVLDNLIHKGDIPPTIALFIQPGDKGPGIPILGGMDNRSIEYDSMNSDYARYLLEELLPEIEHEYAITSDPARRGACGFSSGGICAFTLAWMRPDAFGCVISHCGSFIDIRGGHNYPFMIRKTERKNIKVFLQDGRKDLDMVFGDLKLANQTMAGALAYKGYDYRFEYGEGGHTLMHGGAIFPETLRWLWGEKQ